MTTKRCGLCGRLADEADLVLLRGLKGAVCRPGLGCDKDHYSFALGLGLGLVRLEEIVVDNPKH